MTVASRCKGGCGRFVKATEKFCPDCATVDDAERLSDDSFVACSLGSATIPDSAETGPSGTPLVDVNDYIDDVRKRRADFLERHPEVAATMLRPTSFDDSLPPSVQVKPRFRRWPWRKRR